MYPLFTLASPVLLRFAFAAPGECSTSMDLPGGVYMCSGKDFTPGKGNCTWYPPSEECRYSINYVPQSVGPDPSGYCRFYNDFNCARKETGVEVDGKKIG
jgi:hypothetical protein